MVHKAVILAAGLGSRFLPITRAIPKPMLPIGNKPALDYILAELRASGMDRILIVVGHQRRIIEEYYRGCPAVQFAVQEPLAGTAPALLLAESFADGEPFALCLSDEVIEAQVPCIQQLAEVFARRQASLVMAIEPAAEEKLRVYNCVGVAEMDECGFWPNEYKLTSITEKPQSHFASAYTSIGRYVVAPAIFERIKTLPAAVHSELFLTEAFHLMMKEGTSYGLCYEGKRWDIGTKEGWIETNVRLGLKP